MSRAWVFTLNNPTSDITFKKSMNFLSYVLQEGKENGTPHYQGYVQFQKEKKLDGARQAIPNAHLDIARSKWQTACGYFAELKQPGIETWSGDTNVTPVVEHGEPEDIEPIQRNQGKRTDLAKVMSAIKEGKSYFELMEEFPETVSRHEKFIDKYQSEINYRKLAQVDYPIILPWCTIPKPDFNVKKRHFYICGPPGIGKTPIIQQAFEGKKAFIGANVKYTFEGYKDQEILVWDDHLPKRGEMIDCSNRWLCEKERENGSRFNRSYWPLKQTRTMIILHNRHFPWENIPELVDRFNIINLWPKTDVNALPADRSAGMVPPGVR